MLTGNKILKEVKKGNIIIEPFFTSNLGINSYDITLGDELKVYTNNLIELDSKKENHTKIIEIPEEGYILKPGILYLGTTNERTATDKFVACISGRSSVGRLGINVHVTAGLGSIGFDGKWTLEIFVIEPVRIYKDMKIGQIYFEKPCGKIKDLYRGKYYKQNTVGASKMHTEM